MVKYILSLDSGGIRSTIQIYFLYHLEQDLKRVTGKSVFDTFDFYAGTSGGAIVLGSIVYSKFRTMGDILKNFYNLEIMKKIFKRSAISYIFGPCLRPKYDMTEKYHILYEDIGSKLINDTTKDVLITTYSMTKEMPLFFKSYDNKIENSKTFVVDAINASSAAPGYFPTGKYVYNNGVEYGADGALFANDPSDCAYADALKLYGQQEDIRILSIGTGVVNYPSIGAESTDWGLFQWATEGAIIDKLVDVDTSVVNYRMNQFTKALGHKYIRIQCKTDIAIDQINSMSELEKIADGLYTENRVKLFQVLFPEYTL